MSVLGVTRKEFDDLRLKTGMGLGSFAAMEVAGVNAAIGAAISEVLAIGAVSALSVAAMEYAGRKVAHAGLSGTERKNRLFAF